MTSCSSKRQKYSKDFLFCYWRTYNNNPKRIATFETPDQLLNLFESQEKVIDYPELYEECMRKVDSFQDIYYTYNEIIEEYNTWLDFKSKYAFNYYHYYLCLKN
ncbi:unnamed protein product [Ceutorhynchus assimilis]|uniref:Uncharacterized protein n=1 Tax=Ceutorhynchus assimilis TaxID=467358 RepID=A0A9N9MQA2_9CUCU|nr:unnamed protein product [Ceutorhynchus assimilis]